MISAFKESTMSFDYSAQFDAQRKSQPVPQKLMLDALWRAQVQKAGLGKTGRKWCPQMFDVDREPSAQLEFLRAAREEVALSEMRCSKTIIRAMARSSD